MVGLLVTVLVLVLVMGLCIYVVQLIPLPHPFGPIAVAVVALIFVLIDCSQRLPGFREVR